MEDAGDAAEPAAVVGRRVASSMGSVRFGGSGRPVPSVITASKGPGRAPRVALEAHPTSPFARKLEPETVISLSPRHLSGPRRVQRPATTTVSTMKTVKSRHSTESLTSQGRSRSEMNTTTKPTVDMQTPRAGKSLRHRIQHQVTAEEAATPPTRVIQRDLEAPATNLESYHQLGVSTASGAAKSHADILKTSQETMDPSVKLRESSTRADGGFSHSFRVMEGTHRRPETTRKRFHVAFHPPAASSLPFQPVNDTTRAPTLVSQRYNDHLQPATDLSASLIDNFDAEDHVQDVWKSVDASINQLYADPPIDLVQSALFHASLSANSLSRARRKQRQHQRIVTAAHDLREVQTQQQVEREQVSKRKQQLQALSETIRRRNRKFSRSVDGIEEVKDASSRLKAPNQQSEVSIARRKPPVPRLSGSRVKPGKRKRPRRRQGSDRSETDAGIANPTAKAPTVAGTGVAASILLGDRSVTNSCGQVDPDGHDDDALDLAAGRGTQSEEGESQAPIVRSSKRRGGHRRSTKKADESGQELGNGRAPRPAEALDQRRAIAREYMLMQQQQRAIRKAEQQQREERERENRRRQLETLEKKRLENLKHSRKRRLPQTARRRGKARKETLEVAESSPIVAASDQSGAQVGKSALRTMVETEEQLRHSEAENDGAQGNSVVGYQRQEAFDSVKTPSSVATASRSLLFGGEHVPPSLEKEKEQAGPVNAHVQKLLELRRKAHELSQRLRGIRDVHKTPESGPSGVKAVLIEPDKPQDHEVPSQDGEAQELTVKLDLADDDGLSDVEEDSEDDQSDEGADSDSGEQDGDSDGEVERNRDEDERSETSMTRLQYRDTERQTFRNDTPSTLVDVTDVDVRAIGVYNIAVVWPLVHNEPAAEDPGHRFTEVASSSSSSPSSSEFEDTRSEIGGELGVDSDVARSPILDATSCRSSGDWSAGKMAQLLSSIDSVAKFSSLERPRDDRVGFAMASWRLRLDSAPSDAFNRLVEAEDDSLSVIQRAALKLYERQEELNRAKRDRDKVQRQGESSFESEDESFDREEESPSRQFARLDEIMQQVDRERSLELGATDDQGIDDASGQVDSDEVSPDHGETTTRAPEFWNQLISQSAVEHVEEEEDQWLPRPATRVEMDTSELAAQQYEAQYADADGDARLDQRRRVHSPRSLAKRLLAEVEYQEAINDAQLKLTVMEQSELLQQAQEETLSMATAFKEEMQQSCVSHQLALDHTLLAKRFDDDLHDVAHQLECINELEEQEQEAKRVAMETKLKLAEKRECSVQTEDLRVADVGTSAPLQVDAGTSPIVASVSTAVQYELEGSPESTVSTVAKAEVSIEEEDGDEYQDSESVAVEDSEAGEYGDEGFEQESGLHSRSYRPQERVQDVEDEDIQSEEAESVVESVRSDTGSEIKSSGTGSGEIEEESGGDGAVTASSGHSEAASRVESAVEEYEDDFVASSTTTKAHSAVSSQVDDEVEAESEYGDEDRASDQSVGQVDIEDEAGVDSGVGGDAAGDSDKDVSVEDAFEDEFDGQVDDQDKMQEDDPVSDDQGVQHRSTADAQAATKGSQPPPQASQPLGVSIEANVQLPGFQVVSGHSVDVTQAFMAELERRKQSEMAMLAIRLQTAEAQYTRQVQRIEAAMADTKADTTAVQAELKVQKQRLIIAFKGEQAHIDSLQAAATVRYYQDMLSFQSLYSIEAPSVGIADGPSCGRQESPYFDPVVASKVDVEGVEMASEEGASEGYEDEFASVSQDGRGDARASIADSVERSDVEEEDGGEYESEKQSRAGSVESVVEEETREEGEDADVESDGYTQSEFEDETHDVVEEPAVVLQSSLVDQVDEFEDEMAAAARAQAVSEVDDREGELETSEIHEDGDDQVESQGAEADGGEDNGYDDDFASASESTPHQGSGHSSVADEAVIEDQYGSGEAQEAEEVESTPSVATMEQEQEGSSVESDDRGSESAVAYSEDEFDASKPSEGGQLLVEKSVLDAAESVVASTSEDSSTTKLLAAQVAAVQTTLTVGGDTTRDSDKLMAKKAKVVELLEAKERLLQQQTRAFKLEEEKRLVNEAAHLALGLDVSQELREAKKSIVDELRSEFDALKASFPRLKRSTTTTAIKAVATVVDGGLPAPQGEPPVDGDTRAQSDGEDYEAQSFETASDSGANRRAGDVMSDAQVADDDLDFVSDKYSEFGEDESAAEERVRDDVSGDGDDSVQSQVEEQEEQFETEGGEEEAVPSDEGVKSEEYEDEDEDEDESFADAQSAASVESEDTSADDQPLRVTMKTETGGAEASEYTEDEFEQASESEAALSDHFDADATTPPVTTVADHHVDDRSSVSDNELSTALATVESKLLEEEEEEGGARLQCGADKSSELVLSLADESTRGLAINALPPALESLPASQSTSEEETLTKSIEERLARLEKLKQRIHDRESDIRRVHKQLRIEKHKEKLTVEEKTLWSQVDGLERALQCDIAALELVKQRNRLEMDALDAKQQRNCMGIERDLLTGFDYVEPVELWPTKASVSGRDVDVQVALGVEVECQTMAPPGFQEKTVVSTYRSDLLGGYDYVEDVVAVSLEAEAMEEDDGGGGGILDVSVAVEEARERDVDEENRSIDLLLGYDHVEDVESPLCVVGDDLLAGFHYVEDVERVACRLARDVDDGGSGWSPKDVEELDVSASDGDQEGRSIVPVSADLAARDELRDVADAAGYPEEDEEAGGDDGCADNASLLLLSTEPLDAEEGDRGHESELGEDSSSSVAGVNDRDDGDGATREAGGEPDTEEADAMVLVDTMTSLILDDLLHDVSTRGVTCWPRSKKQSTRQEDTQSTRAGAGSGLDAQVAVVDTVSSLILADLLEDLGSSSMCLLRPKKRSIPECSLPSAQQVARGELDAEEEEEAGAAQVETIASLILDDVVRGIGGEVLRLLRAKRR